MKPIPVSVGDGVSFEKTVGESDIYLFAGITGDLSPNHVNEARMKQTGYGRRIAHGALLIGYMSTTSTKLIELAQSRSDAYYAVSLGYDRIRFLAPVFIGDTIRVDYRIVEIDPARSRTVAEVTVSTEATPSVAVGVHHMKWLPSSPQS